MIGVRLLNQFHISVNIFTDDSAFPVSKVTLDIVCLTAFGYNTDSLHNPDNELADAYHNLLSLQSGGLRICCCMVNALAEVCLYQGQTSRC